MVDLDKELNDSLGEDFEILRKVGEGSKSFVYLARDNALRRLVVIKVLQPKQAEDLETRKRFAREGRSMAKISQRNVIAVHRVGELDNELPFIIMEYVDGRTLKDALEAHGAYDEERSRDVLVQVAKALEAAHAVGIIHRDLRPDNVIEEVDTGRIVLTDFGIAGLAPTTDAAETKLTVQGQLLGNPRYASPEQLQGEPITQHTDSYSLGILGYELLTRRLPYDAKSNVEMLTAHLQKEPIALSELRTGVDPALAELLEKCLNKKPEARPTSADIRARLEAMIAGPAAGGQAVSGRGAKPEGAVQAILSELSRRHVVKVLLIYVGIGGPIAIGTSELLDGILPDKFLLTVRLVFVVGFPVTAVLAWVFDITSEGIQKTNDEAGPGLSRRRMRVLQLGGLAGTVLVAWALWWWFQH